MSTFWVNGTLVDEPNASISVADRGFTLGDGLFETMRAYGGRVFRLPAHLDRLASGARRIGLRLPDGLGDAVRKSLAVSGLEAGSVRLTVSRGPGGQGLLPPDGAEPTCAIVVRPYTPVEGESVRGVRAIVAQGRLNEHAATAGLKSIGYLGAVLAQREARAAGAEDALVLDTSGHLAEGAASNLFVVRGGQLHTPPRSCGILPGITRAAVLEIAAALGVAVREAPLAPDELDEADEAFLTSSLREIVPLVAVGSRAVGRGRPGPLTLRLLAAYRELVRTETNENRA